MNVKHLICVALLLLPEWVQAELDLTIVGVMSDARPVAIVPFSFRGIPNPQGVVSTAPHDMAKIIADDLTRSGRFRAMTVDEMPEKPDNASDVHAQAWRAKGIEALVTGRILEIAVGQYQISYELIDIFKVKDQMHLGLSSNNNDIQKNNEGLLLQMGHSIPLLGYRMQSHRIADRIYEKLTGERGAFATYLAYVNINRHERQPYKLILADSDDHNPRAILSSNEPIMSPAWSKDARRLAYVSFEKARGATVGRAQVIVHDIYSGERITVASFPGLNQAPAWSPDSSKLALVLSYEGNPEIYIYDLVSRTNKRITRNPAIETEPSWSPDGQWLVYTSDRGGKPQLYRMHLATGQEKRLTYEGDYNATASYTPDGKKIVLVNRTQGQFHIGMLDLQSSVLQILSDTQLDQSPSLSPNGSMIVYATLFRGQQILAAVSADGRFKARMQARQGEVRAPAWSPFLD